MSGLGGFLMVVGGIGGMVVDIGASMWLAAEHGIGWVFVAWITFVPLVVIPFLAGLALPFLACLAIYWIGAAIRGAA